MPPCTQQQLTALLLLLINLAASPAAAKGECAVQPPDRVICPAGSVGNAVRASASGLRGELLIGSADSQPLTSLDLLDVSHNPALTGVRFVGAAPASLQIDRLDISNTSALEAAFASSVGRGRIIGHESGAGIVRVRELLAVNWQLISTSPTIDFAELTNVLYAMRVVRFRLAGWRLANVDANFTRANNNCASKRFKSVAVVESLGVDAITGGGRGATIEVGDSVNLTGNGIHTISQVTFRGRSIDLSRNNLTELPGVRFLPGVVCGTPVTGPPELLLGQNRLRLCAISRLLRQQQGAAFAGIDLSGNPQLLVDEPKNCHKTDSANDTNAKVSVTDFLRLAGVAGSQSGREEQLAWLIGQFRSDDGLRLDLSNNSIQEAVFINSLPLTSLGGLVELDLSGNPLIGDIDFDALRKRAPRLRFLRLRGTSRYMSFSALMSSANSTTPPSLLPLVGLWSPPLKLELDQATLEGQCQYQLSDSRRIVCWLAASATTAVVPTATSPPSAVLVVVTSAALAVVLIGCCIGFLTLQLSRLYRRMHRRAVYKLSHGAQTRTLH